MKLPRKGILIRLCIYIPLLLFFGWQAWQKWRADHAPPEAPMIDGPRHTFTLPDGKSVEVVEISEDQARQMGLDPAELNRGPKPADGGAAKASPEGEAKSPPAAPAGAN